MDARSPHFNDRAGDVYPSIIVVHATGGGTLESIISWFRNPSARVSSHYIIGRDGRIAQVVPLDKRAWHAGYSFWGGISDVNSYSIGIELVNKDDGIDEYPVEQLNSLGVLCSALSSLYDIEVEDIVGHKDVSLAGKTDPQGLDLGELRDYVGEMKRMVNPSAAGEYDRNTGWLCPRCDRVNAPWRSVCECGKSRFVYPDMEIKDGEDNEEDEDDEAEKDVTAVPYGESPYIVGLHEPGGEWLVCDPPGWILFTHDLGHDPSHQGGFDYTPWTDAGFGVIARLNNGYEPRGTIPHRENYVNFAQRCANWVRNSCGCHLWIVGNEPNHMVEWPHGEYIEPKGYAECFAVTRNKIKEVSGEHKVIIAGVAPWYYPPDWLQYQEDMMGEIVRLGGADGISLHTYTHGSDPGLITSDDRMNSPFEDRRFHFWAYKDMIARFPRELRNLPIYITETNQTEPWADANSGWCVRAVREIERWNDGGRQGIHCLIFYRWPEYDKWHIKGKRDLYEDIQAANELRVSRPGYSEEDNNNDDNDDNDDDDNQAPGGNMKEVWREDFDGEYHSQDGIPEVKVPLRTDGTTLKAVWYEGNVDGFSASYVRPEIEREKASDFPYRVFSGTASWNQFNSYATHFAGGYVRFPKLTIGAEYMFSIQGHVWTSSSVEGDPPVSSGDAYNCQSFLALGPQGQRDLFDSGVIIGDHKWGDAWDKYTEYTISFIAQVERPAVFFMARFKHPVQNNNMFWDAARLYQLGVDEEDDDDDDDDNDNGNGDSVSEARVREIAQQEIERFVTYREVIFPWSE